jgi:hypothetical protein
VGLLSFEQKRILETEIKRFVRSRALTVRDAYNNTAICDPISQTMWDPQYLTTLWVFKVCYWDSVTFYFRLNTFLASYTFTSMSYIN